MDKVLRTKVSLADFLRGAGYRHGGGEFGAEIPRARDQELIDFNLFERLLASEHVRDQGDLGEVLDGFHLHVSVLEGVAVRDYAVI